MEVAVKPKKKKSQQRQKPSVETSEKTPLTFQTSKDIESSLEEKNEPNQSWYMDEKSFYSDEPRLLEFSKDPVAVHAPIYIDNSVNEKNLSETGTELEEISAPVLICNHETASTDFQNNIAQTDTAKEDFTVEESVKTFNYLSIEEDEFSILTKLARQPSDINAFTEAQLLAIYRNEELELVDSFIETFIDAELKSGAVQQHPLYALLINYIRAREKLVASANEIEIFLNDCKQLQQNLWILETLKITETGECQDGNPVEASHEYQSGKFDHSAFNKLSSNLANIRELVNGQHSLYSYSCQVCKLKVESYIGKITEKFSSIPHNTPVCLASDSTIRTADVCSAISVLFYFHRQPISDVEFKADARNWLTRLVAILLRVSSWSQHMFILNHVLRCPSSVLKWAVCFIQPPAAPFNSPNPGNYLNHIIATLATIVKPISERNNFIIESEGIHEEVWVFVDSDGEDAEESNFSPTCLKENDIIAVLNQIPLECLFRQMVQMVKRDDTDVYISMSSSQLLRVFAMSHQIMKILYEGMKTYESKSHSQFCKRLASILTHTIHYITDIWEAFR